MPLDSQPHEMEFKPSTDRKIFLSLNIFFPHQSTQLWGEREGRCGEGGKAGVGGGGRAGVGREGGQVW